MFNSSAPLALKKDTKAPPTFKGGIPIKELGQKENL
jgi:hypothetical protein